LSCRTSSNSFVPSELFPFFPFFAWDILQRSNNPLFCVCLTQSCRLRPIEINAWAAVFDRLGFSLRVFERFSELMKRWPPQPAIMQLSRIETCNVTVDSIWFKSHCSSMSALDSLLGWLGRDPSTTPSAFPNGWQGSQQFLSALVAVLWVYGAIGSGWGAHCWTRPCRLQGLRPASEVVSVGKSVEFLVICFQL
jgi:hypothetical protein